MERFFKIISNVKLQNILLWIVVALFEFGPLFNGSFKGIISSNVYWLTALKIVLLAAATYLNTLILIPRLLKLKKYIYFVLANIINVLIFSFLMFVVTVFSYNDVGIDDSGWEHHVLYLISIIYILVFIVATTLVYFIKEWYKLKDVANQMIKLEKEKLESEHQALKAQLNPHFLFNTLNNLYSLSVAKSDLVPQTILKLSDLMSYILYECKEDLVDLDKEIEFLNNYIALEKLRSSKTKLSFNYEVNGSKVRISPLLFIPFIENAFKHSKSDNSNPEIKIDLIVDENNLRFSCVNSVGSEKNKVDSKYGGVGIDNVKKRLNLLYPERHSLNLSETDTHFKAAMQIKL